jgi:nudix-type nucleoside diphosphatase (YffH/AdpP family)
MQDQVAIRQVQLLSDDWGVLKKTRFALRRGDGPWREQTRETYDRGNGATLLLYNRARRSVVLTRQFRLPAYVNGHDGFMVEAAAGLLDGAQPEERIRAEVEEETGFRVRRVTRLWDAFMSPGSVTERLHFFVAEYEADDRVGAGGGVAEEGEDLEVLELGIDAALAMIGSGIVDAKTIMLLQYARQHLFAPPGLMILIAGPYRATWRRWKPMSSPCSVPATCRCWANGWRCRPRAWPARGRPATPSSMRSSTRMRSACWRAATRCCGFPACRPAPN